MKKTTLLLLLFCMLPLGSWAQVNPETADPEEAERVRIAMEQGYWMSGDRKLLNRADFWDNWFIGAEVGTVFNWGGKKSSLNFFEHVRPTFALYGGKWVSPYLGGRLHLSYQRNVEESEDQGIPKYSWNSYALFVDGMWSITNTFWGYKENRHLNLIAIFGIGGEITGGFTKNIGSDLISTQSQQLLAGRIGLSLKIRLNEMLDADITAYNTFVDDSYDGQISNNRWDGHLNIFAGLSYRFKNHDETRQFTYARYNFTKLEALNDEVNRLREQVEEAQAVPPEIQHEYVYNTRLNTLIVFNEGSAKIDPLQEVNVYTAADAMREAQNRVDLYITVNNDKEATNKELFYQRAQAIRDVLVNHYNIPGGRIFIEPNPSIIYSLQKTTNCVVVWIND